MIFVQRVFMLAEHGRYTNFVILFCCLLIDAHGLVWKMVVYS